MGKITRSRRKYHSTIKPNSSLIKSEGDGFSLESASLPEAINLPSFSELLPAHENIFSGLKISLDSLKKDLDVHSVCIDESRSEISKKSFKSDRPISKKAKRQFRHEAFLSKLNAERDYEIERRETRKRQKTAITGDLKPLADALPDVFQNVFQKSSPIPSKPRSVPSSKKRHRNLLEDFEWMNQAIASKMAKTS